MKTASCIREIKDQQKIDAYTQLIRNISGEYQRTSKLIGLIGNEVRLKLIWLINEARFCVCDLADILQMTNPAISQHLRKLKDAGIIESEREKQTLYYRISKENEHMVAHLLKLVPEPIGI